MPALTNAAPDRGDRVPRARSLRTMMGWRYWTRRLLFVSKEYPPGYRGRRVSTLPLTLPDCFPPGYQVTASAMLSVGGIGKLIRGWHRQCCPLRSGRVLLLLVAVGLESLFVLVLADLLFSLLYDAAHY